MRTVRLLPPRSLFGLIDASEATDTYGSPFGAVRGFCTGAWPGMRCAGGFAADHELVVPRELRVDTATLSHPERASPGLVSFVEDVAPTLSAADLVVFCYAWEQPGSSPLAGLGEAVAALETAARVGSRVRAPWRGIPALGCRPPFPLPTLVPTAGRARHRRPLLRAGRGRVAWSRGVGPSRPRPRCCASRGVL